MSLPLPSYPRKSKVPSTMARQTLSFRELTAEREEGDKEWSLVMCELNNFSVLLTHRFDWLEELEISRSSTQTSPPSSLGLHRSGHSLLPSFVDHACYTVSKLADELDLWRSHYGHGRLFRFRSQIGAVKSSLPQSLSDVLDNGATNSTAEQNYGFAAEARNIVDGQKELPATAFARFRALLELTGAITGEAFSLRNRIILLDRQPDASKRHLQSSMPAPSSVLSNLRQTRHDAPDSMRARYTARRVLQKGESPLLQGARQNGEVSTDHSHVPKEMSLLAYQDFAKAVQGYVRTARQEMKNWEEENGLAELQGYADPLFPSPFRIVSRGEGTDSITAAGSTVDDQSKQQQPLAHKAAGHQPEQVSRDDTDHEDDGDDTPGWLSRAMNDIVQPRPDPSLNRIHGPADTATRRLAANMDNLRYHDLLFQHQRDLFEGSARQRPVLGENLVSSARAANLNRTRAIRKQRTEQWAASLALSAFNLSLDSDQKTACSATADDNHDNDDSASVTTASVSQLSTDVDSAQQQTVPVSESGSV